MNYNKCLNCEKEVVFVLPSLCRNHFSEYVEEKVFSTIYKYHLLEAGEKIVVAASGGKDSLTLLHILSKKYLLECLSVDEGIENYREKTISVLRKFCGERNIPLTVVSYKEEFGGNLDKFLSGKGAPCSTCGTFRRYLLNKYAKEYDKICTGHNMDDEAQAVIMNLIRPNIEAMAKTGPVSGISKNKSFVQRVKPLYFLREKEIVTYAFLNGIPLDFDECPHAGESYRAKVRDLLNDYEARNPGTKQGIVDFFISILPKIKSSVRINGVNSCICCNEPSKEEVCNTCKILQSKKPNQLIQIS